MDRQELDSKIERRKRQAEKRGLLYKVNEVAVGLGVDYSTGDKRTGTNDFVYEDEKLWIQAYSVWETGSDGMAGGFSKTVKYEGKEVFSSGMVGISSYIPGNWEKVLDKLYAKAILILEERREESELEKKSQAQSKIDEKVERWGL